MNIPEVDQKTVARITRAIPRVREEIGVDVVVIAVVNFLPRADSLVLGILMTYLLSAVRRHLELY